MYLGVGRGSEEGERDGVIDGKAKGWFSSELEFKMLTWYFNYLVGILLLTWLDVIGSLQDIVGS